MDKKFHVSENGPGECHAQDGKCPFGGSSGVENHYGSMREATQEFDKRMKDKEFSSLSKNNVQDNAAMTAEDYENAMIGFDQEWKEQASAIRKLLAPRREILESRYAHHSTQIQQLQHDLANAENQEQITAIKSEIQKNNLTQDQIQYQIAKFDKDYTETLESLSAEIGAKRRVVMEAYKNSPKNATTINKAKEAEEQKIKAAKAAEAKKKRIAKRERVDTPLTTMSREEAKATLIKYAQSRRLENETWNKVYSAGDTEERKERLKELADIKDKTAQHVRELEQSGYGKLIPDDGPTLRVRNRAQKTLMESELKGQISDGYWENASDNTEAWQQWSDAKVIVDPENVGRNFLAKKDNYQLNAKAMISVVGDRMVDSVQREPEYKDGYDEKIMNSDLQDLRTIFKSYRPNHDGVDTQRW